MLYAVFFDAKILYFGPNQQEAFEVFQNNKGSTLKQVDSIDEIKELKCDNLSKNLDEILEKLKKINFENSTIDEIINSEKIAEVKYLGIKSMKTVGEGFVALGDLINKASGNLSEKLDKNN
jgi:hypothetical protein